MFEKKCISTFIVSRVMLLGKCETETSVTYRSDETFGLKLRRPLILTTFQDHHSFPQLSSLVMLHVSVIKARSRP